MDCCDLQYSALVAAPIYTTNQDGRVKYYYFIV